MTDYEILILQTLNKASQKKLSRYKLLRKLGGIDSTYLSFDLNRALPGLEEYIETVIENKTVYYRLRQMDTLIPGEYDKVSRQSMSPARLRSAHQTTCTPETAYFLIAVMHEKHFPGQPMPIVRLRAPIAGKHKARGWGGVKTKDGIRRGYISLPKTPMIDQRNPYGMLRIGLVCHEFAHAFEVLKFNKSDHGLRFTMILDSLLLETEQYWRV